MRRWHLLQAQDPGAGLHGADVDFIDVSGPPVGEPGAECDVVALSDARLAVALGLAIGVADGVDGDPGDMRELWDVLEADGLITTVESHRWPLVTERGYDWLIEAMS